MFYILSIYLFSVMLCQAMSSTLVDRLKHKELRKYPNIIDAIRTLSQVSYIPFFNTLYAFIIGYYYFRNGFKI